MARWLEASEDLQLRDAFDDADRARVAVADSAGAAPLTARRGKDELGRKWEISVASPVLSFLVVAAALSDA